MIELVVIYCLRADPTQCVERREAMTDYASVAACTGQAQVVAREYLAGHPRWMLKGWRCEIDKPREDPA
jgi:hypothetical protein